MGSLFGSTNLFRKAVACSLNRESAHRSLKDSSGPNSQRQMQLAHPAKWEGRGRRAGKGEAWSQSVAGGTMEIGLQSVCYKPSGQYRVDVALAGYCFGTLFTSSPNSRAASSSATLSGGRIPSPFGLPR